MANSLPASAASTGAPPDGAKGARYNADCVLCMTILRERTCCEASRREVDAGVVLQLSSLAGAGSGSSHDQVGGPMFASRARRRTLTGPASRGPRALAPGADMTSENARQRAWAGYRREPNAKVDLCRPGKTELFFWKACSPCTEPARSSLSSLRPSSPPQRARWSVSPCVPRAGAVGSLEDPSIELARPPSHSQPRSTLNRGD